MGIFRKITRPKASVDVQLHANTLRDGKALQNFALAVSKGERI